MFLTKSDIKKISDKNFQIVADIFSERISHDELIEFVKSSQRPLVKYGSQKQEALFNMFYNESLACEQSKLLDIYQSNTSEYYYTHTKLKALKCEEIHFQQESSNVESTIRILNQFGLGDKNKFFEIAVRSEMEEFTSLDEDTRMVIFKESNYRTRGTSSYMHWFLIRGHEFGSWVAKIGYIFELLTKEETISSGIIEKTINGFEYGIVAHESDLEKLEKLLNPNQIVKYYAICDKIRENEYKNLMKNSIFSFWNLTKNCKINAGIWKIKKEVIEETHAIQDTFKGLTVTKEITEPEFVNYIFNDGHVTIETKLPFAVKIYDIDTRDEASLIGFILDSFKNRPNQKNLKINGVNVRFSTTQHGRVKLFDILIKKSEEKEIITQFCCYHTEQEMIGLVDDCSKLSLEYRSYIYEGITTHIYMSLQGKTREEIHERGVRRNAVIMYNENKDEYYCVNERVLIKFRFKRKNNGKRGIALVLNDGREFNIKKAKSLKMKRVCYGKESFIEKLKKIIKGNVTDQDCEQIIDDALNNQVESIENSKKLLEEIQETLGAKKDRIMVENKYYDCYKITGSSGTEYAVVDKAPKFPVYKAVDGSWRFVCIETSSNLDQEVGKDGIITRLYALLNDEDSKKDISTI